MTRIKNLWNDLTELEGLLAFLLTMWAVVSSLLVHQVGATAQQVAAALAGVALTLYIVQKIVELHAAYQKGGWAAVLAKLEQLATALPTSIGQIENTVLHGADPGQSLPPIPSAPVAPPTAPTVHAGSGVFTPASVEFHSIS